MIKKNKLYIKESKLTLLKRINTLESEKEALEDTINKLQSDICKVVLKKIDEDDTTIKLRKNNTNLRLKIKKLKAELENIKGGNK